MRVAVYYSNNDVRFENIWDVSKRDTPLSKVSPNRMVPENVE